MGSLDLQLLLMPPPVDLQQLAMPLPRPAPYLTAQIEHDF
jgi:hypothetical protein